MPIDWQGTTITWLGHATFVVDSPGGQRMVFDPWLEGNPMCPERYHDLADVHWILVTHGHFDHMGSAEVLAKRTDATVVSNFEIASFLETHGVTHTIGMNKGGTVDLGGARATMVAADHSSGISTEHGIIYGGEAAGYVVRLVNGLTLYHAGDTNVFSEMALIHELYAPDVVLLPIGGHFTMAPKEAAYAVRMLQPKAVIPMHYGTFPALAGEPAALEDLLKGTGVEVLTLRPGESLH